MSQKPAKPAPRQDAMQKQKEQELIAESGIVAPPAAATPSTA